MRSQKSLVIVLVAATLFSGNARACTVDDPGIWFAYGVSPDFSFMSGLTCFIFLALVFFLRKSTFLFVFLLVTLAIVIFQYTEMKRYVVACTETQFYVATIFLSIYVIIAVVAFIRIKLSNHV